VHEPTRHDHILDLVLTNNYRLISDLHVLDPFGSGDHNVVQFSINVASDGNTFDDGEVLYYDFENANYDLIELYLVSINWAYEFTFVFDTEGYWDIFLSYMNNAIQL
jgi:hypothetical protein